MTGRAFHSAPGRENARPAIEYARVKARLANWTDGAVLLVNDKAPAPMWVPRRRLAPVSQALVYRHARGDEIEIEIELTTALEKRLV